MALIKFGLVVTEARGKLGGHVFTKTKAGAALRTATAPTNPQSPAQQAVRENFGAMARLWSNLTAEQVEAWNVASENFKKTNIFGDQFQYSGFNLFMQLNQNLATAGVAPKLDAPRSSSISAGVKMTAAYADFTDGQVSGIVIDMVVRGDASNVMYVVTATAPKSTGVRNFSGMHRIIDVTADATDPEVILLSYQRKFGSLPLGSRIELGLYIIDKANGVKSIPQYMQFDTIPPVTP